MKVFNSRLVSVKVGVMEFGLIRTEVGQNGEAHNQRDDQA